MNRHEANQLLDMAKEGQGIPEEVINEALGVSGDDLLARFVPCPAVEEFVNEMRRAGLL